MNSDKVIVDQDQCRILGEFIKTRSIPAAQEELIKYNISNLVLNNLYFTIVSICHQTTPHNGPALQGYIDGKLRRGWDYLREKWIKAVEYNPTRVSRTSLAWLSAQDIEEILIDETLGSTISDLKGRAILLNDIGRKMLAFNFKDIQSLYEISGGYLVSDKEAGLIELCEHFLAYNADPVKKKLYFFLALMFNQGLWQYHDPENLGTPVDYHEARGHLRCQTVKVVDQDLEDKILNGREVMEEEDVQIRKAIFEAIMLISKFSGRTPNDLHYFFWNIFRNCCRRDETHCNSCGQHLSLPDRYQRLSPGQCIFSGSCKSAGLKIKLTDHVINTNLY